MVEMVGQQRKIDSKENVCKLMILVLNPGQNEPTTRTSMQRRDMKFGKIAGHL